MTPQGALVFKFEEVFCDAIPNYAALDQLIRKEEQASAASPKLLGWGERLLALKKRMPPKAYRQVRLLATSEAEKAETESLLATPLLPGVTTALESAHTAGWLVAVASEFSKVSVSKVLKQKSLAGHVDLTAARTRIDEGRQLSKRLSPVKRKVKSLSKVVYFCNRSQEVKEAKLLGVRCIVLPSKTEPFRTLLWAEPEGMILSLEELPQLLALPSMKLPEQVEAGAKSSSAQGAEGSPAGKGVGPDSPTSTHR